jgi:hypothetical protein
MAYRPDPVLPVASALLLALGDALEGDDAPVCRLGFAFGNPPPADDCCACPDPDAPSRSGYAWVRLGLIWPTKVFPNPVAAADACPAAGLAATFTLGIYRCAPTLSEGGQMPTPDELGDALVRQTQDAALLRSVISGVLGDGADGLDLPYLPGTWSPLEPLGGCMGGSVEITVQVTANACP